MEYKTIKIPTATYDAVKKAQLELVKKGIDNVPKEITQKCPFCHTPLDSVSVGYSYAECPKCHYKQQGFNLDARGTFAIGIVIGLGIAALLASLLSEK